MAFGPNPEFWRRYGETCNRKYRDNRNKEIKDFNHCVQFASNTKMEYSFYRSSFRNNVNERVRAILNSSPGNELGEVARHALIWGLFRTSSMHTAIFHWRTSSRICTQSKIQERNPMHKSCSTRLKSWLTNKIWKHREWQNWAGQSLHGWSWPLRTAERRPSSCRLKSTYSQILHYVSGKYTNTPDLKRGWENRSSWFRGTNQGRERDGIDGEPVEFEWRKNPGHTSQQIVYEIQTLVKSLNCTEEDFQGRIIFMSTFNDIEWENKDNKKVCSANSLVVSMLQPTPYHEIWIDCGRQNSRETSSNSVLHSFWIWQNLGRARKVRPDTAQARCVQTIFGSQSRCSVSGQNWSCSKQRVEVLSDTIKLDFLQDTVLA